MAHIINLLFLGYLILWPLFRSTVFELDGAGRIYMLLSAMVMIVNLPSARFRSTLKSPMCWIWLIWIAYTVVNWLRIGLPPNGDISSSSFIFVYLILPFLSMWVAAYEMQIHPKKLMKSLLIFLVLYLIWGLIFTMVTPASVDRQSQVLGNEFALTALSMIAISCISFNMSLIKMRTLAVIIALSTIAIFQIATRKAFAGELILLFMFYLSRNNKLNLGNILKISIVLLLVYVSIDYVLDKTVIGQRFMSLEEDAEKYNTTNYGILSLLGDRAFFYIEGWGLFMSHPVMGIGINNFMSFTHYPMPIHSEYMVQLVENGVIGSIIFLFFVVSLWRTSSRISEIGFRRMALGWVFCMLFVSLTSWIYDMPQFFMIFGLIIGLQKYFRSNRMP